MTKINSWKCDICKKFFIDVQGDFVAVTISIPANGQFEFEEKFNFADVCLNCRQSLREYINNFLADRENKQMIQERIDKQ